MEDLHMLSKEILRLNEDFQDKVLLLDPQTNDLHEYYNIMYQIYMITGTLVLKLQSLHKTQLENESKS